MFRNYLTIALRNIVRHKLYSAINIAGLALGLTCVILITLFVRDELSYDRWIPGSDRLYRVEMTFYPPGRPPIPLAQIAMPMPLAMRDNIPEVRAATRLARENMSITVGDKHFSERVTVVDPNFLQVIPLPLIAGDPRTVLAHPESVVLSQSLARKYFGNADPIGKTISPLKPACAPGAAVCDNSTVPLTVTGVMADLPHNTQLYADMLVPNTSVVDRIDQETKHNWLSNNMTFGYVVLAPGADPAQILAKFRPVIDRSVDLTRYTNAKLAVSQILEVRLVPFRDAHLSTDQYFGMKPPGSWTTLYGMGAIGLLILLVACFNFMNLATARATMRAREISLRKCVGARRVQLMTQFLSESVVIALFALVLALALAEVLLPLFGSFLQVPLHASLSDRLAPDPGLCRCCRPSRPSGRSLSRAGDFRFPSRCRAQGQPVGQSGLRYPAHRPGGAAVRGVHRPWHRGRGGVPADRFCPPPRPGFPAQQYRGHQHQPADGHRHEGLCRRPGTRAGRYQRGALNRDRL